MHHGRLPAVCDDGARPRGSAPGSEHPAHGGPAQPGHRRRLCRGGAGRQDPPGRSRAARIALTRDNGAGAWELPAEWRMSSRAGARAHPLGVTVATGPLPHTHLIGRGGEEKRSASSAFSLVGGGEVGRGLPASNGLRRIGTATGYHTRPSKTAEKESMMKQTVESHSRNTTCATSPGRREAVVS